MSSNGDQGALADVTNSMQSANLNAGNADAVERGKASGFIEPSKFDYDAYNADSSDKRKALEATHEAPVWAANATRYEWEDEYGDVGPEFKELEVMLFGDEDHVRAGDRFGK